MCLNCPDKCRVCKEKTTVFVLCFVYKEKENLQRCHAGMPSFVYIQQLKEIKNNIRC